MFKYYVKSFSVLLQLLLYYLLAGVLNTYIKYRIKVMD